MLNSAVILLVLVSVYCQITFFHNYFNERNVNVNGLCFFLSFNTAIHEHETMFWDCEFSGCTSKTVTKVVNGIIMIKRIQPLHSTDCSKAQAERNSSKPENEVNPGDSKILTLNNGLAKDDGLLSDWSSDDLYDSSSSEGDDESESDLFEGWSTVDDETDDQTENNDENFNQIKKSGPSAICDDDSDSLVEVCSPKAPIDQKCVRR